MERAYSLTDEELQIVFAGLGKLPLEVSVLVWNKLQQRRQAHEQPRLVGGADWTEEEHAAGLVGTR